MHRDVRAAFETKLVAAIDKIFGAGDAPVLVTAVAVDKNRGLLRDALAKGATVRCTATSAPRRSLAGAHAPRRGGGQRPEAGTRITHRELLGRAWALYEVESEEGAATPPTTPSTGLTAAVFTEDLRRG